MGPSASRFARSEATPSRRTGSLLDISPGAYTLEIQVKGYRLWTDSVLVGEETQNSTQRVEVLLDRE